VQKATVEQHDAENAFGRLGQILVERIRAAFYGPWNRLYRCISRDNSFNTSVVNNATLRANK
jgi:hypothetical protein